MAQGWSTSQKLACMEVTHTTKDKSRWTICSGNGNQFQNTKSNKTFVLQKSAAPKNVVEFPQKSIAAIRCSLAVSYDVTLLLKKVEMYFTDKIYKEVSPRARDPRQTSK